MKTKTKLIGAGVVAFLGIGIAGGWDEDPVPAKIVTPAVSISVTPSAESVAVAKSPKPSKSPKVVKKSPKPKPKKTYEPDIVSYANCTELRQDYPRGVPAGHKAYDSSMDRDDDGFACEKN